MPAPSAQRPASATARLPATKKAGPSAPRRPLESKAGPNDLELHPPSPAPLPESFQLRTDLARHQKRIEHLISELRSQLPQITAQVIRQELSAAPLLANNPVMALPVPVAVPGMVDPEAEPKHEEMEVRRHLSSGESTPVRPSHSTGLEAWGEDEAEAEAARRTLKLERDKFKGVKDLLDSKIKGSADGSSRISLRRLARKVVSNSKFEGFCASLIILCAVLIGAEAHWSMENLGSSEPVVFRVLNSIFNFAFTIELLLRFIADGLYFLSCNNASIHWNLIDTFLVASGLVEECLLFLYTFNVNLSGLKILRMLRLARILRIVKVVRFFSELRVMVNGVLGSAKSLAWALLLLVLVNFLFGILFMMLSIEYLETVDPTADLLTYFGSLPRTMLTLYASISGGIDWSNAVATLRPVSIWMEYIFSAYVFFTVFCCMNIVTGIFVDNAKALKVADEEAMHHEAMKERQKWIAEVAELFFKITRENEGRLTKDLFVHHVSHTDRIATCFNHLGINTETTNTDELWELFDCDESGCIDQDEFAMGVKQFHGFARSIDLFKLRREVQRFIKMVKKQGF